MVLRKKFFICAKIGTEWQIHRYTIHGTVPPQPDLHETNRSQALYLNIVENPNPSNPFLPLLHGLKEFAQLDLRTINHGNARWHGPLIFHGNRRR
jgi:hypothetical protein